MCEAEMAVPALRITPLNAAALRPDGDFVVYWMIAARRPSYNFGLQRAAEAASELGKPLLVLEALRSDYPWASERLHRFVLDGMADNQAAFAKTHAHYYPYVEPERGAGKGLLETLTKRAALVVTDDFPCFFLPRMARAAAAREQIRFEAVDSNGLVPLRAVDRAYSRAFDFRRFLTRALPEHAPAAPLENPLNKARLPAFPGLPRAVSERWPRASAELLAGEAAALTRLPIDHRVGRATQAGGFRAARRQLDAFLEHKLLAFADARNHPDADGASSLSASLHFGHLSAHEVFSRVLALEDLTLAELRGRSQGEPKALWQMRPGAEAFLDQLVTWRELGYNFCHHHPDDYDQFHSLPSWSKATLLAHEKDPRGHVYSAKQLENAATDDELWNAAQRELVESGKLQGYLRMLWGKRTLTWTRSAEEAFALLIELNNKYALDGRNPNSYSGISWCFGRYDRPWPERSIFGTVRTMTSESARRKLKLSAYLSRWAKRTTGRLPDI
jgi:deoxyribodipyrimidine photo-lyase